MMMLRCHQGSKRGQRICEDVLASLPGFHPCRQESGRASARAGSDALGTMLFVSRKSPVTLVSVVILSNEAALGWVRGPTDHDLALVEVELANVLPPKHLGEFSKLDEDEETQA